MELATFIRNHKEEITTEWVRFAQDNIEQTFSMEVAEVTDHIKEMLDWIAEDMDSSQTDDQQEEKSKGNKKFEGEEGGAASDHGEQRLDFGFSFMQLSSEFRALRASVFRLWANKSRKENWEVDFYDMIRFNEAIDEMWMISLKRFQDKLDRSKNLFLGILGHDLRNPIATMKGANSILQLSKHLTEKEKKVLELSQSSSKKMTELIDNLLELAELRLGTGMTIKRTRVDLQEYSEKIVHELRLGNPQARISIESSESVEGQWDVLRLEQMINNLVINAIRHGKPGGIVRVNVSSKGDQALFRVHNDGPPISEDIKEEIFNERFTQGNDSPGKEKNYGLGLLIVKEIVEGHQGEIQVTSSKKEGTTFTIILPRELSN